MLVEQHLHSKRAEVSAPGPRPGIAIVVAQDEDDTMCGFQVGKRRHVTGQALRRAIDDVGREHDQIGLQRVAHLDHTSHVALADGRSDMQIADLHDAKALECERQSIDGDANLPHLRPS